MAVQGLITTKQNEYQVSKERNGMGCHQEQIVQIYLYFTMWIHN